MEKEIEKTNGSINTSDNIKEERKPTSPKRRILGFIRRLQVKEPSSTWKWKIRFLGTSSSGFKWKLRAGRYLHFYFLYDVLFKIVSVLEAVVLVSTLCFFFLCCGCHF